MDKKEISIRNHQDLADKLQRSKTQAWLRSPPESNNISKFINFIFLQIQSFNSLCKRIMFYQDIFYPAEQGEQYNQLQAEVSQELHPYSVFDCLENHSTPNYSNLETINTQVLVPTFQVDFIQIDFFPVRKAQKPNKQDSLSDEERLDSYKDEEESEKKSKNQTETYFKLSNNTADYVIKHCLKKMFTEECRTRLISYCEQLNVTYKQFTGYWRNQLKNLMSKHIGINKFKKILAENSSFAKILKYFCTVYLQRQYKIYVVKSSINNKQAYLDCAIKIIYLIQSSKGKANQKARTGLKN